LLAATLLALAAPTVYADCLSDAAITAMAAAYMAGKPAANPEGLSQADGECSRAKLHKVLGPQMGKPVGYKAGLTNPAVQKRFNANAPVWGLLYANMLLPDGSLVDANFGARPLYEADLLVRVGSESINTARTAAEVLKRSTRSSRSSNCPTSWSRRRPSSTARPSPPSTLARGWESLANPSQCP